MTAAAVAGRPVDRANNCTVWVKPHGRKKRQRSEQRGVPVAVAALFTLLDAQDAGQPSGKRDTGSGQSRRDPGEPGPRDDEHHRGHEQQDDPEGLRRGTRHARRRGRIPGPLTGRRMA